jgi:hypothetical protein
MFLFCLNLCFSLKDLLPGSKAFIDRIGLYFKV